MDISKCIEREFIAGQLRVEGLRVGCAIVIEHLFGVGAVHSAGLPSRFPSLF